MSIQELIQKNKSEFEMTYGDCDILNEQMCCIEKDCLCNKMSYLESIADWHTQSLKDLIDAVIESREKAKKEQKYEDNDYFEYSIIETYNEALDDTIKDLKAIKELL